MADKYYAHSLEGKPPEEGHCLEDHLKNVAEMARELLEGFGACEPVWRLNTKHKWR
jgi:hypothetical protein